MDEMKILAGLNGLRHQDRLDAVGKLSSDVRNSGDRLRFKAQDKLFSLLAKLLGDSNWTVRRDTIGLLSDLIPRAGAKKGNCIRQILPALLQNLGDIKVAIRRGAVSVIKICYQHRPETLDLAPMVIAEGIENAEARIRSEALRFLEGGLPWDKSTDTEILQLGESIVGRLRDVDTDVLLLACRVLEGLPIMIGEGSFAALIGSLHPTLQQLYESVLTVHQQQTGPSGLRSSSDGAASMTESSGLEYGLITSSTLADLCNDRYEVRCVAIEELESAVNNVERTSSIIPHLEQILNLLVQLIADTNLKVALGALEVMGQLAQKVGFSMKPHLENIMVPLTRMFGDSQVVVRQAVGKLMFRLMQSLTAASIFEALLVHVNDSNWRVREEICNVIILNLVKVPHNELDFPRMVRALQPLLSDEKKRVKFVCLEAFGAIRKALGVAAYESVLEKTLPWSLIQELELFQEPDIRRPPGTGDSASPITPRYGSSVGPRDSPGTAGSGRPPRSASKKLPWDIDGDGSRSSSGSARKGYTPSPSSANRRLRAASSSESERGTSRRHRSGSIGSLTSSRPRLSSALSRDSDDTYIPSRPETQTSRRDRVLSASSDSRTDSANNPFPTTARVRSRPGTMNRRSSFSEDPLSVSWGSGGGVGGNTPSSASKTSGIPAPSASSLIRMSSLNGIDDLRESQELALERNEVTSSSIPKPAALNTPGTPSSPVVVRSRPRSAVGSPFQAAPARLKKSGESKSRTPSVPSPSDSIPEYDDTAAVVMPLTRAQASLDLNADLPLGSSGDDQDTSLNDDDGYRSQQSPPIIAESPPPQPKSLARPNPNKASRSRSGSNPTKDAPVQQQLSDFEAELIAKAKAKKNGNFSASHTPSKEVNGDDHDHDFSPGDVNDAFESPSDGSDVESSTPPRSLLSKQPRGALSGSLNRSIKQAQKSTASLGVNTPSNRGSSPSRSRYSPTPPSSKSGPTIKTPSRPARTLSRSPVGSRSSAANGRASPAAVRKPPSSVSKPPPSSSSSGMSRIDSSRVNSAHQAPVGRSASGSSNDALLIPLEELEPHPSPLSALKPAYESIKRGATQETWAEATVGLVSVRQLVMYNPDVVLGDLHAVVEAVLREVQNLRSIVARLAIMTIGDLVERLAKPIEGKELDRSIAALLKKAGAEAGSSFIIASIDECLDRIIRSVSTGKFISSLLLNSSHKASIVRRMVAEKICKSIEIVQLKIYSIKDLDRMLVCLFKFAEDTDPGIRYQSRKSMYLLGSHDCFDQALAKALSGSALSRANDAVEKVRRNGPGAPPKDPKARSVSAGIRESSSPKRPVPPKHDPETSSGTPTRKTRTRVPSARSGAGVRRANSAAPMSPALTEKLNELIATLTSADWKMRDAAVEAAEALVVREGVALKPGLGRFFDAFGERLSDSNSKVNRKALESFGRMIPHLSEAFEGQAPLINELVSKISPNLASKNKVISDEAFAALSGMCEALGHGILLPPLANAAGYGTVKTKEMVVALLARRTESFFEDNQKVAKRQFTMLVGQLLGDTKHKSDLTRLCTSLVNLLGVDGVLQAAITLPPNKQKMLETELSSSVYRGGGIAAVGRRSASVKRDRNRTV